MRLETAILFALTVMEVSAAPSMRLAKMFADNMVLQRDCPVKI